MRYYFGRGFDRWIPYILLGPGMVLYLLLALGPSLVTVVYSFTDASGIAGAAIHWIGLANYHEFLLLGEASRDNLAALERTMIFCVFVTVIQFVLGLLVALLLNQRLRGSNFFRTLFFMPVILGVTIQSLMWELFLFPLGGPMEKLVELFGTHSEFLGGSAAEKFTWVIIIQIWANLGVTMVIFLAGLQTIPDELVEAARIDGANSWQVFRHVTWPLLTPSANTNMLLNIIGSLQAWQLFLLLVGYTNGTQVLGYVIYAQGFGLTSSNPTAQTFRQGFAASAAVMLFLLVLAIGLTVQHLLRRREERIMG